MLGGSCVSGGNSVPRSCPCCSCRCPCCSCRYPSCPCRCCVCLCLCLFWARATNNREIQRERERERENQPRRKKTERERERDVPQPPIYGSIGLMSVIRLTTTICNPISVRCPLSAVRCLSLSLSVCCCASVLIVLLLVRFHVPCCAFLFCFHFACTTKHDEPKAKV